MYITRITTLVFCLAVRLFAQGLAINTAWLPVTLEERQGGPKVDKNAGVEALFWRVHVMDEVAGGELERVLYHYVRLKVFNEEGKKKLANIDIEFGDKTAILYIAGRSIKADGTEVELKSGDIHERDLVRAGRIRRKVKSFAIPGVEPGAIVEYRWKEVRRDLGWLYTRLQMQREYPVQKVQYFVRPLPADYSAGYRMSVWPFNCQPSELKPERDGFSSMYLENVPAFREEPMMPGEANVRPWTLILYSDDKKREPEKYWQKVGKEAYDRLKLSLKVNDELKAAAAKAVEGASTEEKPIRLIRYMRANFRTLFDRSVSDAERMKVIKSMPKSRNRTSIEVFKSGIGTADELNTLFAALAEAVGLEARPALVASRSDTVFHPQMAESYFLRSIDMAMKSGDQWKLYDVSTKLLPPTMVGWNEEGMQALVSDAKTPVFIQSPISPPDASVTLRNGKLALNADGTLEGDIIEARSGHAAAERRLDFEGESTERQVESLKEELLRLFPSGEVSDIKIANVDDSEQPLTISYRIKLPAYAQRTGKRLLLQPLYFQQGTEPLFSAAERQFDIDFRFAWKEDDNITITLPEGYQLDNAESPGGMDLGQAGAYKIEMGIRGNEFVCRRVFTFGDKGMLAFPKTAYPQIKKVFDEVHRRDGHTISLKAAQ